MRKGARAQSDCGEMEEKNIRVTKGKVKGRKAGERQTSRSEREEEEKRNRC